MHGGSVGFNFGLLLDELKIWASENLNGVVLDKYSRYISNVISGKKSNETISILYAACAWSHKKSFLTKKWSASHASYAFPWSNKINNLL